MTADATYCRAIVISAPGIFVQLFCVGAVVVGATVGFAVGFTVGFAVGAAVGSVGFTVGLAADERVANLHRGVSFWLVEAKTEER